MRLRTILGRAVRRRVAVAVAVAVAGASLGSLPVLAPAASAAVPPEAGQYVPVNPTRIVTRGSVPPVTSSVPNAAFTFTPTGVSGMPPSVSAVQFQLSTNAAGTGTLIAYPAGAARPTATTIPYRPNVQMSNDVVVKLGTNNQVSIANVPSTGTAVTAPVWIDVVGYYTGAGAAAAASTYVPLTPSRLLSQRPMMAGIASAVAPLGLVGVPTTGVSAVMAQVTVGATGNPPAAGTAQVYPGPTAPSPVTDISYGADYFYTNLVPAKLGPDGQFRVVTSTATTLTVDIVGYFDSSTGAGSTFVGLPSSRLPGTNIGPGQTLTVPGLGQGGVPGTGVTALSYNLTAKGNGTTAGTPDNLVAYPADLAPPSTGGFYYRSGIYFSTQQTTKLGAGGIKILNRSTSQSAQVFVDITGYYTRAALPDPPTGVTAIPGDRSATVSWQRPAGNPTNVPTGYAVLTTPGNTVTQVNGGTVSTAQIAGLTNGTDYTFTVASLNGTGRSAYSAPSAAVTPSAPQPPGAPLITDIYPRDGALRVSWSAPTVGSSALTGYRITTTPATTTTQVGPTVTEAVIGGLTNGQRYAVTVTAVNGVGAGTPATDPQLMAPRPADPPLAPSVTALVPGNAGATVQWVAPADAGAPVTGYTVTASVGGTVAQTVHTAADTTVAAFTGLINGTAYTVAVTATNNAGTSDPGTAGPVTPAARVAPGVPTHISAAVAAAGSIKVQWQPPDSAGTAPVSGYTVTASPGGATVTTPGTGTAATVSGLNTNTDYTFTVRAASADGTGPGSPATAPLSPALQVTATPVVLSGAALATLRQVHTGALDFERPPAQVTGLQPGQIVVAHPSAQTPNGLLRAVTGISNSNGLFVVATREAAMNEVLAAGGVVQDSTLDTGDVAAFTPAAPGVQLRQPTIKGRTAAQGAPRIGNGTEPADLDSEIGIRDGALVIEFEHTDNRQGKSPVVSKIEVQFTVKPILRAHVHLGLGGVDTQFGLSVQTTGQLQYKAGLGGERVAKVTLAHLRLSCIDIQVGLLPVVICTEVDVLWEVSGAVSLGLTSSVSFNREFGGMLTSHNFDVDAQAINIAGPTSGDGPHNTYVDGSLRLSFPWEFLFLLYGAIGPEVEPTPYIELTIDTSSTPVAELRLGLSVGAKFALSKLLGGRELFGDDDILDFFVTVWHSPTDITTMETDHKTQQTKVNEPVQFTLTGQGNLPPVVPATWSVIEGVGTVDQNGRYVSGQVGYAIIKVVPKTLQVEPILVGVIVGPNVPLAVRDVQAVPGRLAAVVSWTPPASDGGSPITGYAVSSSGGGVFSANPGDTSVRVPHLDSTKSYTFEVRASNAVGQSPPMTTGSVTPLEALLRIGGANDVAVDADGQPDSAELAQNAGTLLSGNGRYAFFITSGQSNLAPPEIADPDNTAQYLLRKDLQTGAIDLASRGPDGRTPEPVATPRVAVNRDGTVVVFETNPFPFHALVHDLAHLSTWDAHIEDLSFGLTNGFQLSDDGTVVGAMGAPTPGKSRAYRVTQSGRVPVDNCAGGRVCAYAFDMSADGNRFLVEQDDANGAGGHTMIYTIGGSAIDITPQDGGHTASPFVVGRLSADGSTVAVVAQADDGTFDLVVLKVGSGPISHFASVEVHEQAVEQVAVNRDGRIVAYLAAADESDPNNPAFVARLFNTAVGGSVALPQLPGTNGVGRPVSVSDDGTVVAWTQCTMAANGSCIRVPGNWVQRFG